MADRTIRYYNNNNNNNNNNCNTNKDTKIPVDCCNSTNTTNIQIESFKFTWNYFTVNKCENQFHNNLDIEYNNQYPNQYHCQYYHHYEKQETMSEHKRMMMMMMIEDDIKLISTELVSTIILPSVTITSSSPSSSPSPSASSPSSLKLSKIDDKITIISFIKESYPKRINRRQDVREYFEDISPDTNHHYSIKLNDQLDDDNDSISFNNNCYLLGFNDHNRNNDLKTYVAANEANNNYNNNNKKNYYDHQNIDNNNDEISCNSGILNGHVNFNNIINKNLFILLIQWLWLCLGTCKLFYLIYCENNNNNNNKNAVKLYDQIFNNKNNKNINENYCEKLKNYENQMKISTRFWNNKKFNNIFLINKFLLKYFLITTLIIGCCSAAKQEVTTNCTFPQKWEGSWFLSGYQESIQIKGSQFSYRGKCIASENNKYLIVDEKGCHRCLVIYEKHTNVLQYKESECDGDSYYMDQSSYNNPAAMPIRSIINSDRVGGAAHPNSRFSSLEPCTGSYDDPSYCKGREILQNLCDQIPGDALLYSIFREQAEPVKCPLRGPYTFTYSQGHGECKTPLSNIDSCTEESRLLLSFQACPDVQGTESTVEELTCLATWKDGNSRYLVGLVSHHHAISKEDRFRCFVYEKTSTMIGYSYSGLTSGSYGNGNLKDAEYKLAQSGDATCNGLDSADVGSRIMTLQKPAPAERCDFPVWLKEPRHWYSLKGNFGYQFHSSDGSMHITRPNGYTDTRAFCEQINKQTLNEMTAVVHFTSGCKKGFMCMTFYRRDINIAEIQMGQPASRLEDACLPDHFDTTRMSYVTLLASNSEDSKCPTDGLYHLIGAIGPPNIISRHKRNHNNNNNQKHYQNNNYDNIKRQQYGHHQHKYHHQHHPHHHQHHYHEKQLAYKQEHHHGEHQQEQQEHHNYYHNNNNNNNNKDELKGHKSHDDPTNHKISGFQTNLQSIERNSIANNDNKNAPSTDTNNNLNHRTRRYVNHNNDSIDSDDKNSPVVLNSILDNPINKKTQTTNRNETNIDNNFNFISSLANNQLTLNNKFTAIDNINEIQQLDNSTVLKTELNMNSNENSLTENNMTSKLMKTSSPNNNQKQQQQQEQQQKQQQNDYRIKLNNGTFNENDSIINRINMPMNATASNEPFKVEKNHFHLPHQQNYHHHHHHQLKNHKINHHHHHHQYEENDLQHHVYKETNVFNRNVKHLGTEIDGKSIEIFNELHKKHQQQQQKYQQPQRNRRDAPGCTVNYKTQRQLRIGCTDTNQIDVRPQCNDDNEVYICYGSWIENMNTYILARHLGTQHLICLTYIPFIGNEAKLVIGDECYHHLNDRQSTNLIMTNITRFGQCGDSASVKPHSSNNFTILILSLILTTWIHLRHSIR